MPGAGVLVGRGYIEIRPEFTGDWDRTLNNQSVRSGNSAGASGGSAFGKAFGKGMTGMAGIIKTSLAGAGIAAAAVGAQQLGSAIVAASAVAAPALATIGTAGAAIGVGLKGVGAAFKAFDSAAADASKAAAATKAVEAAQRSLAKAQAGVGDARVQAAQRIREAQARVTDAERDLTAAQRDARDIQATLNSARLEGARALEDMNTRLATSVLDERDAVLRQAEAEKDLKAAQAEPGTDPAELARLQLAYDRATQGLAQQRVEHERLAVDTAKANKAGVEGSDQVVAARGRIAAADEAVASRQRALGEAQAGVTQARVDGDGQIKNAQEAVADAVRAVAEAQAAAASQTSAVAEAMAKLTPSAREFVTAVKAMGPAWGEVRKATQESLFSGLGDSFKEMSTQIIPDVRDGLSGAAGQLNLMAKSWMSTVAEMSKTGLLKQMFEGVTSSLGDLVRIPGEATQGFAQLSVAAQPVFSRMTTALGDASTRLSDRMTAAFDDGRMTAAIDAGVDVLLKFVGVLVDVGSVLVNVFKSAQDTGGDMLSMIGTGVKELARITALPEIQSAMKAIFTAMGQVASATFQVIGAVIQAVLPLLAAVAPVIGQIAATLGPVLAQLATVLGQALMPIIQAAMPLLQVIGGALIQMIQALTPLLAPLGAVIAQIVNVAVAVLTPIIGVIVQLVQALAGPLTMIIQTLVPYIALIGQAFTSIFAALMPAIQPLIGAVGLLAQMFAELFAAAVQQVMAVITPMIPMLVTLATTVVGALVNLLPVLFPIVQQLADAFLSVLSAVLPLIPPLLQLGVQIIGSLIGLLPAIAPLFTSVATALVGIVQALLPLIPVGIQLVQSVLTALLPILPAIAQTVGILAQALIALLPPIVGVVQQIAGQLVPIIQNLTPVLTQMASVISVGLMTILPVLATAFVQLVQAALPILPVVAELAGMLVQLAGDVLMQLMPSLGELVAAAVVLLVALLPIIPPLVEIIGLAITLGVSVLGALLPPLVTLAGWLVEGVAWALGVAIHWVSEIIIWFATMGEKVSWLWDLGVRAFGAIGAGATLMWTGAIKPAIDGIVGAVQWVGDKFQWLWDKIIWPIFGWIGDKIGQTLGGISSGFQSTLDGIARLWGGLQEIAAAPIRFIIDKVYNNGIRAVWNWIAGKVGLPQLDEVPLNFATGGVVPAGAYGVLPGYSPGRDTMLAAVSPGEAWLRPEAARWLGSDGIDEINYRARTGSLPAYGFGGIVGGVVDKVKSGIKSIPGVGSVIKLVGDVVRGGLAKAAELGLKPIRALINTLPGSGEWVDAIKKIPLSGIDGIIDKLKGKDAEDTGGAAVAKGLEWAKTQSGKPYEWGGNGMPSWDCSGFMAAIESVILGQAPHRKWTTFDFQGSHAPPGWKQDLDAPFRIGITNNGVGHTAGTLAGVNVESRGGDGVIVGARARGWNDSLFQTHYGFEPSLKSAGGPVPTGRLLAWIDAALQATHTPPPGTLDAWRSGMATIIGRESGGNPLAVNTTDSNARAGTPSKGLAQVIGPTFDAYRVNSLPNDILDPVANIAASIQYIRGRYGNISAVQQADPTKPPLGYDAGGWLQPGDTIAANRTGAPEPVLTSAQWTTMQQLAVNRGGTTGLDGPITLVVQDGPTLTAYVDRRVDAGHDRAARAFDLGPKG